MPINIEDLRKHYASLTDDAFLAIDRAELHPEAQSVYEAERAERLGSGPKFDPPTRRFSTPARLDERNYADPDAIDADTTDAPKPEWYDSAAIAFTFEAFPGKPAGELADHARSVLEAAGIPCYLWAYEWMKDPTRGQQYEYRLMVPGNMILQANSILDQEIFNVEIEAEWRTHFEMLSDDDLRELDSKTLFAGLQDRIHRVTRAYTEELSRRGLTSRRR